MQTRFNCPIEPIDWRDGSFESLLDLMTQQEIQALLDGNFCEKVEWDLKTARS